MANLATIADRRRMRIERVARKRLRREFMRYARVAADSPRALGRPTQIHRDRVKRILAAAYEVAILLGVELSEEQLVKSRKQNDERVVVKRSGSGWLVYFDGHTIGDDPEPKPHAEALAEAREYRERIAHILKQTEATEALIERLLREWVEDRAFNLATSISSGSRAIAQRTLEEGINQGLGERELARSIRLAIGGLTRARSLTIARTETHGAMLNAGAAAANDLGATEKEWVAIEDSRTRSSHRAADGQTVPLGGKFNVGGAALRFPGDPDAGAPGETINCRCALAYR